MMKFKESRDSIASELLLWRERPTQIAIQDTFDLTVHPVSSIYNDGQINFDISSQPKAMMTGIDIITKFRIMKGANRMGENDECSIINNFANSLWDLVGCTVSDRINLMQSMRNSYAYQTYFDYCLNSDRNRADYLFSTQLFLMDDGATKADVENISYRGEDVKNIAARDRYERIAESKSVSVTSKLHSPLFTTSKALPTNMTVRVSLSKNKDSFLLLASTNDFRVEILDVHLNVSYVRPTEVFLSMIEERISKQAALYFITKPEIIIKPISQHGRIVRINEIFHGKLPRSAFFCILQSKDFEGSFQSSPFAFIPFSKFQLYINGSPYFNEALEVEYSLDKDNQKVYKENWRYLQQLYKTIGRDVKGCPLINSANFQSNFMVGVSLTGDRAASTATYLSPHTQASTQIEIDFGYDINVAQDLILLVYAVHDRLVKISADRELEIAD